jgi:hypothetical protein
MMWKVRRPGLHPEREEVGSGLGGAVYRGVISEHQWREVKLPVEGVLLDDAGEVFGDEFVHDLRLRVALRMVRRGSGVFDLEEAVQFVRDLSGKFFAVVGDDFLWKTVTADPSVEDGVTDSGGLLIREGQNLGVFVESIRDTQDVFLAGFGGPERPEEIGVNALIGGRTLRKRVKDVRRRAIVLAGVEAALAGAEVLGNVSVHTRPIV